LRSLQNSKTLFNLVTKEDRAIRADRAARALRALRAAIVPGANFISIQGDTIWQFFTNLSTFRKLIVIFFRNEVPQRNCDILGYFCLSKSLTFPPAIAVSKHVKFFQSGLM
jgi:hypothetical protein